MQEPIDGLDRPRFEAEPTRPPRDANIPYRSLRQDQVQAMLDAWRDGEGESGARARGEALGVTAAEFDGFLRRNRDSIWRATTARAPMGAR